MPSTPPQNRSELLQPAAVFKAVLVACAAVALVAGGLWLLVSLRVVLLMGVAAIFFAHLVAPLVDRLEAPLGKPLLPRTAAVAAAYVLIFGSIAVAGDILAPRLGRQLTSLTAVAPGAVAKLQAQAQAYMASFQSRDIPPAVHARVDALVSQLESRGNAMAEAAAISATGIFSYVPWLVLVPVLSFFFLKDARTLRSMALRNLQGRARWQGSDYFDEVNRVLAGYIRVQILTSLIVGVVYAIGFKALGLPYGLGLAMLAFVLDFIPMVGPVLAIVIACAVALASGMFPQTLATIVTLRMILSYGVNPKLMSQGLSLHPLAVIVALLCGSQLGGGWGLFLAIPMVAIGSVTYRYVRNWQPVAAEPPDLPAILTQPFPLAKPVNNRVLTGARVLVVDNDQDAREIVALALVAQGATVIQANSAQAALAKLQTERPDALVSDIGMPDEDGLDLIRQVRALDAAHGGLTPATALTGYATEEDRSRILAAGFQAHLSKPVQTEDLVGAIQQLLNPRIRASA